MTNLIKPLPRWKGFLAAICVVPLLVYGVVVGFVLWPLIEGIKIGIEAGREFWEFPDDDGK